MATVRDTDLPDLLISLGYQVKRIGRYYTTQEMDSIRIKDRRTWFRYSEGIGGDAITFLQRFYNKSFPEAVEYLLTWHGRARDSPPVSTPRQTKEKEEKVPFTLPPANVDHRRVFAYGQHRKNGSKRTRRAGQIGWPSHSQNGCDWKAGWETACKSVSGTTGPPCGGGGSQAGTNPNGRKGGPCDRQTGRTGGKPRTTRCDHGS